MDISEPSEMMTIAVLEIGIDGTVMEVQVVVPGFGEVDVQLLEPFADVHPHCPQLAPFVWDCQRWIDVLVH